MFGILLRKELAQHLGDYRFLSVFAFCTVLAVAGVGVAVETYSQQLKEYSAAPGGWGPYWMRPPEVLSPVVTGVSQVLGRQVSVVSSPGQFEQSPAVFQNSPYEASPGHALFGVLDLAFIVETLLSLAVIVFTYDAVCGEKQGGTLRLTASFPVSKASIAGAKLVGSALAVMVPLAFAFLLIGLVLGQSTVLDLSVDDWMRLGALFVVFMLYLAVFAAFGIGVSALTHSRLTAFLALLGLWGIWILVIPTLARQTARSLEPVTSFYEIQRRYNALRWELAGESYEERIAYLRRNRPEWAGLDESEKASIWWGGRTAPPHPAIRSKWYNELRTQIQALEAERRNQMERQHGLLKALAAASPLGAVRFVSADLARTGWGQQARIERAYNAYYTEFLNLIQKWETMPPDQRQAPEPFHYTDDDTVWDAFGRNVAHLLNLVLLAVLGFVGAFVSIVRYDVR